ncbi:MAG TPA: DUF554 domain-containing protein [Clostridiales bacterium]|nr:DUF554 domain-containing protein [Clostridiales bacterium]
MWGTIVNSIAIIAGSLLGLLIKGGIGERYRKLITQGLGLAICVLGIMDAIKTNNIILVIVSLMIGAIIGERIGIDYRISGLGEWIQSKIGKKDSRFSHGFITATLVYCVGAMAIMGSLESGLYDNHRILYVKSALDGVTSIVLASTMGIGVIFSAASVFIYQGLITLGAALLKSYLNETVVTEMSAVGGILILAIGVSMLEIKKIKVANLLPAVFIPIVYDILIKAFRLLA